MRLSNGRKAIIVHHLLCPERWMTRAIGTPSRMMSRRPMIGIMVKWYSGGITSQTPPQYRVISIMARLHCGRYQYDLRSAPALTKIKGEHTSGLVFGEEPL